MQAQIIERTIPMSRTDRIRSIPPGGEHCLQEPFEEKISVYATVARVRKERGYRLKTHVETTSEGKKVISIWRIQ